MKTTFSTLFSNRLLASFGKSFDPGQLRDDSGKWTAGGGSAFVAEGAEDRPVDVGEDAGVDLNRLRRLHGLDVDLSPHAALKASESVHKALGPLPVGLRNAMKANGVKIKIVNSQDAPKESFEVGGAKFMKAGHADYRNNEILLWDDVATRGVVTHEAGHMAVRALCSVVAQNEDRGEAITEEWRGIRKREREIEDVFYNTHDRPIKQGDDPEWDKLQVRVDEIDKEKKQIQTLHKALRDFGDATMKEGGITEYADAYVKDKDRGWKSDIWEYRGKMESREWGRWEEEYKQNKAQYDEARTNYDRLQGELNQLFSDLRGKLGREPVPNDDPNIMRIVNERDKHAPALDKFGHTPPREPYRPRSSISRAANENFAEITEILMYHADAKGRRESMKEIVQRQRPETAKAFKKLWSVFGRKFNVPKTVEA